MSAQRTYFNLLVDGKLSRAVETVGVPLRLPRLDAEFAIVRPYAPLGDKSYAKSGWQVIHVRSGLRVMYTDFCESTQAAAKASAMAKIEWAIKKYGLKFVQYKAKTFKNALIVKALAKAQA